MVKCQICDRKFKSLSCHLGRNKNNHPSIEQYYKDFIGDVKYCYCGNKNSFVNLVIGYHEYCSLKCSANSQETKDKKIQTCKDNYGVEHPSKSKEVQDKKKKTCLEKYGVENVSQLNTIKDKKKQKSIQKYGTECVLNSKIIKNKIKKTCLKKYGVIHYSKSLEFKNKIKKTCLDRYGIDNPMKSEVVREKSKQTCLEKYGVESYSKTKEFKEKSKQTCLDRYGVEHPVQSKEIKQKTKQTCIEKYGVEHPSQVEKFKEKSKQTCLKKYDVEYVLQNEKLKEKIRKICLEKYGVDNPLKSNVIKDRMKKTQKINFYKKLLNSDRLKDLVTPLFQKKDYIGSSGYNKYPWKCNKCNNEFEDNLDNGKIPRCLKCYPYLAGTSKGELEVLEFIKQYYPNAKSNRTILDGKEIDIYIEELKLGVEYHGLYWHSEFNGNKEPKYHQEKHLLAKSKGIQLIQIFEDEWLNKRDIVKSILLNKMGKSPNKIFARKCIIKEDPNKEAKQFLFDNHLQGEINGIHLGLYFKSELVSLITMGKSRFNKKYDYEILRFCNKLNYSITGGLSKLLSHFKKLNPNSSIITYADARYGEGKGYENCGFIYKELSKPNYFYLNKQVSRESRIKYQKHKLKDLLEVFDSTLTEWQNMQLNGFDRIWDCGNYVYNYRS